MNLSKLLIYIVGINILLGFICFGYLAYRLVGLFSLIFTMIFIVLVVMGLLELSKEEQAKREKYRS